MSAYLDEAYFDWLYDEVYSSGDPDAKSYRDLFHILFTTEFVWLVPNDDNRVEDGKALRYQFLSDVGIDVHSSEDYWLDLSCSILELLLAVAQRLHFETGTDSIFWVYELLENLNLARFDDESPMDEEYVTDILHNFTWRIYAPNGQGGLFPLKESRSDQRDVEIWYQLNAYLLERL